MLKLFAELLKNIPELTIDVDEFETVSVSGLPNDSDGLWVKGESLEMALSALTVQYPGRFPVCELMLAGKLLTEEPVKTVHLEPVREVGIDHPFFSEIRSDLDRCIRRGIDAAGDGIAAAIPLKIAIKRDPFTGAAQISHSISLNVTQKKHANKGSIRDFQVRYDESGHMITFDEQITLDELPAPAGEIDDTDPDEDMPEQLAIEGIAAEEPALDPFDEPAEPEPEKAPEQKFGGLIQDIWTSLGVGSAVRLMNAETDIVATVAGFVDRKGKHGPNWTLRVISESGDEELVDQGLVDILVWDNVWFYRKLPELAGVPA